jgi:phosphatidylglycerol:prolipoprotein diacylglycerol transferase
VRDGLGNGLTVKDVDDMLIYGVLGVILGGPARLRPLLQAAVLHAHPAEILQIWSGGMSFHGGFIGVMLGIAIFCW